MVAAVSIFAVWLLFGLVGVGLTVWLVRRVWQRRKTASLGAKLLASVATAAGLCSGVGTLLAVVKAFGAVSGNSVDPSQKARVLAEGISEAMNSIAFGLVVWVPSVIIAFVLTRPSKPSAQS